MYEGGDRKTRRLARNPKISLERVDQLDADVKLAAVDETLAEHLIAKDGAAQSSVSAKPHQASRCGRKPTQR